MTDEGHLTCVFAIFMHCKLLTRWCSFQGFLQIYSLQTENDEEARNPILILLLLLTFHPQETYRDLAKHGFSRNLELIGN